VLQYVTKFMKVVASERSSSAEAHAKQFIKQTASNAGDLRRNPLMLGLMCWLFNQRRDVPSNRPEIYRECAILMFERWDPDRGVLVSIPRNFDRLQLFSELASQIYGKPEYAAGVEIGWLARDHN
jgi:predicted NACHT family NTPase